MQKIILAVISFCICSCASHPAVDTWGDATLVAEQRAEIEQLRRDIADLATTQRQISERIGYAAERLESSLDRITTIEELWAAADEFVRSILAENERLRSLQPTDWGADAGS